jgi:hypothetical protein
MNWSIKDWIFLSSFFGTLGSFLLVKGIIFNLHSQEESASFWGSNPFSSLGNEKRKSENILGLAFIFLSFLLQFVSVLIPNRWNIPKCNLLYGNRIYLILAIFFLISLGSIFFPTHAALRKFRKENAQTYLDRIDEQILEVRHGYLRKDLRDKSDEEREKITNLLQCIEGTKAQIAENISNTQKLFSIKVKGCNDLELLRNIRKHLNKWRCL